MKRPLTEDEQKALNWWRDKLSLNEQKAFAKEVHGSLWEYVWGSVHYILEVWEKKGRPS